MRKICVKMVPRLLHDEQKQHHVHVCLDFLNDLKLNHSRIITGDKAYHLLTKKKAKNLNLLIYSKMNYS